MASLSLSPPEIFLKDRIQQNGMVESHVTTAWKTAKTILGSQYPKPEPPVSDEIMAENKHNTDKPKAKAKPGPDIEEDDLSSESDESADTPCLLYTSPSPRDLSTSRMPSSA